jgi:hypothetical protein
VARRYRVGILRQYAPAGISASRER